MLIPGFPAVTPGFPTVIPGLTRNPFSCVVSDPRRSNGFRVKPGMTGFW